MTKWTDHLRRTLARAADVARQSRSPAITPDHIIIGLLSEKGAIGRELLLQSIKKKPLPRARRASALGAPHAIPFSPETERLLLAAAGNARRHEHCYVGTEHLLEALLTLCAPTLQEHGVTTRTIERLERDLAVIMKSAAHFSDMVPSHSEKHGRTATKTRGRGKHQSALDAFCRDLVKAAGEGTIDPVIGREEEIDRVMTILARRTKNNPMLLGESGVGKTAIVEGLALRIANGTAPAPLLGKRILSLDVGAIVAGTVWRGAFEERMKKIVDELRDATDTVLFIDEVHTILGAGSASGSLDAANFLKPALARGSVRCIGATTIQDYKKTIETDGALERRFQPVIVLEPTPEKTIAILEGLRPLYEQHHGVAITHDAITAAVTLAKRHFPTAMLPDKAIDLLDEAAAALALAMAVDIRQETIREAGREIRMLQEKKEHAVDAASFEEATLLKKEGDRLAGMLAAITKEPAPARERPLLTTASIAATVANIVHLPRSAVAIGSGTMLDWGKQLGETIIGQTAGLTTIADTLRRSLAGFARDGRPRASFLFVGPSGVGKTATAKLLAELLFPNESALVRIDMGELTQGFQLSKLIGAPPGYVGYREGTALSDAIKNRPSSVVLFDEIEKAHPEVLSLLLSLFDEGALTDATGRRISFRETIIICTANIPGVRAMGFGETSGAPSTHDAVKQAVQKILPLPLTNRLDALVPFTPLSAMHITELVQRKCARIVAELSRRGTAITISDEAVTLLARLAHTPDEGARAVHRIVQKYVENPVAAILTAGKPSAIRIAVKDDIIVVES